MNRFLSIFTALLLTAALVGCSSGTENGTTSSSLSDQVSTQPPVEADFSADADDMFTKRDLDSDYSMSGAVKIELDGDKASSSSHQAKVEGTTVTLTAEATYIIKGSLADGSVIVDAPDTAKLQIVLDGAEITSGNSAAIYVKNADKVVITLAEGSENTLANGGEFATTDDGVDGAVFSKQDISFNGNGSLTVTSPAGHGIVSKDDLAITSGNYVISAASHGIDANDSIRLRDASFTVEAGKDALHCENADDSSLGFIFALSGSYDLESEGDGISAGAYVQIEDGEFNITAGGGSENGTKEHSDNYGGFGGGMGGPGGMGGRSADNSVVAYTTSDSDSTSMKGIKAVSGILINGGEFDINSADDSIHSDTSVIINGGKITIASGDDGIHAENKLTVTAGKITITESYEGLEATDIELLGGDIDLKATDDGLNSAGGNDESGMTGGRDGMYGGGKGGPGGMSAGNGTVVISGGSLYVNASGDGIDANGSFELSGGNVTVVGPTHGDTATLDYDTSAVVKGGTFIGTGASGMAKTFSDSSQGVISLSVGNQPAETVIKIEDSDGNEIITASPELNFAVVIISCPELVKGENYKVYVGEQSGEFKAE